MNQAQKLALILSSLTMWNCQATDYFFDPRFSANQRYDTNIRLRPKPPQANWVSTFSPGVDMGFRNENNELNANFTWNQIVYDNQTDLNIDEQLSSVNYRHTHERFNWGLITSYNNQSSLNTESNTTGATGELAIQLMRKQLNIAPSLTYALDNKNSLDINYSYTDFSYQETKARVNLYDYKYQQGSIGLSHSYSERDKLSFTLSSSLYELPGKAVTLTRPSFSQTSLTETAQLGWQHSFTEQLSANLSFGMRYSQTDSVTEGPSPPSYLTDSKGKAIFINGKPVLLGYLDTNHHLHKNPVLITSNSSNDNIGQIFSASIQKTFERGTLSFSASQQLSPSAQGNQEQKQFSAYGTFALSERWNSGIDATYQISTFPLQSQSAKSFTSGNRTYYAITPRISWKWTPEINLQLSYTYRQQTYDNPSLSSGGEGNIAQLQFNYQPQINRQVK